MLYYMHNNSISAKVLEQGPDLWRLFNAIQFSYHCVHPIHAKCFQSERYFISITVQGFAFKCFSFFATSEGHTVEAIYCTYTCICSLICMHFFMFNNKQRNTSNQKRRKFMKDYMRIAYHFCYIFSALFTNSTVNACWVSNFELSNKLES